MANTISSHRVVVSKESLVKFPNVYFKQFVYENRFDGKLQVTFHMGLWSWSLGP